MFEFLGQEGGWAAGVVGTLAGILVALRKSQKTWVADSREIENISTETHVVNLLRQEWTRAMENNRALAEQVTRLHNQWDQTLQSNRALADQVEKLQNLVDELRSEIVSLKQQPPKSGVGG